ncbi:N-formylglutamate amidohydrolase [Hyphomicrobium denitrificans 1NES1]|uniref:N-formylglutamate amidohydrolase n=1 Tax=Hyphomicrobium denitrificans 1NES1 TaxID=670307 RepID=N0BF44_9HYPH|nr:N-formylglutamate amidohydrolase [Hyphomicrobium denitrificans]AGK59041.1 N-formylglutamate amidohydrolase [Hyphomicrobium denitrificans 1NES1]
MSETHLHSVPSAFFPSFDVLPPRVQTAPFVFSSPHSGRLYPPEFVAISRLDPKTLRRSEDCFVDKLFCPVAELGAPLISARFPRAYLDLNREPYELDPELVGEDLPAHANTQSIRVAGGLGTVARIVADGEEIYPNRLSLESVLDRIEQLYFPFHAELSRLIAQTNEMFGYAVLIDCHSMPSAAMAPGGALRPDIVIGDRFGASSDPRLTLLVRNEFQRRGFKVQLNRPYAGGYITEHHGRPAHGTHALQLEINRGLYMNEMTFEPNNGYTALAKALDEIVRCLFAEVPTLLDFRAAAE